MSESVESRLAYEIAEQRHGQHVTASDLANRLMPWLAAELRKAKAEALRDLAKDTDALEAAEAKIAAVRELHEPGPIEEVWGHSRTHPDGTLVCRECTDPDNWWVLHPCPTIKLLDGENE